jgi:hypothetical protein
MRVLANADQHQQRHDGVLPNDRLRMQQMRTQGAPRTQQIKQIERSTASNPKAAPPCGDAAFFQFP